VTIDLACLAILAAWSVRGATTGLVRQLATLLAVALAVLGARLAGPAVAAALGALLPAFLARHAAGVLVFVVLSLALGFLFRLAAGSARGSGAIPPGPDRALGALLGGVKAALVVWVAVSAAVAWGRPLGVAADTLAGSDVAAFAREHDALGVLRKSSGDSERDRREAAAAQFDGRFDR
jgi:uncharacterized membrane protein required for colicin V production